MKASQFPREYRAYDLSENKMLTPEQLADKGVSIAPDGLPYFNNEPFNLVVLWYTGHQDSHGKKLFEGDIVKVEMQNEFGSVTEEYGVMRYDPNHMCFIIMVPDQEPGRSFNGANIKKVGNEFENPEFLPLINA